MNRTYLMSLSYINPDSHWTAGIGRLYLPWASSLETIDGAYVASQFASHTLGWNLCRLNARSIRVGLQPAAQNRRRLLQCPWWKLRRLPLFDHRGCGRGDAEVGYRSALRIHREQLLVQALLLSLPLDADRSADSKSFDARGQHWTRPEPALAACAGPSTCRRSI